MMLALGLAMLLTAALADAHSWYPPGCCNAKADDASGDCEPVPCEEMSENQDGSWTYAGAHFEKAHVHPSQDRYCHACIAEWNPAQGLCLFIQQGV